MVARPAEGANRGLGEGRERENQSGPDGRDDTPDLTIRFQSKLISAGAVGSRLAATASDRPYHSRWHPECEHPVGHVARYHRASAGCRAAADPPRRDEQRVAAQARPFANLSSILLSRLCIEIARNRAGSNVDPLPDVGVAEIANVV